MSLSSWMTHLPRTSLENMPRQTWTETHGNKVTGAPEDDVLPMNSQQGKKQNRPYLQRWLFIGTVVRSLWRKFWVPNSATIIAAPWGKHNKWLLVVTLGLNQGAGAFWVQQSMLGLSVTNEYSHWSWHKLHFPPSYGKMNGLGERCCGERWGSLGLMAESTQH